MVMRISCIVSLCFCLMFSVSVLLLLVLLCLVPSTTLHPLVTAVHYSIYSTSTSTGLYRSSLGELTGAVLGGRIRLGTCNLTTVWNHPKLLGGYSTTRAATVTDEKSDLLHKTTGTTVDNAYLVKINNNNNYKGANNISDSPFVVGLNDAIEQILSKCSTTKVLRMYKHQYTFSIINVHDDDLIHILNDPFVEYVEPVSTL